MRMIVEQLVEWRLAGETEVLGENLPQLHSLLDWGIMNQYLGIQNN
jgi:hypothetical protein